MTDSLSARKTPICPKDIRIGRARKGPSCRALLAGLWRSNTVHFIGLLDRDTKKFRNIATDDFERTINETSDSRCDLYFACAEYHTPENRTAGNAAGACAFWLDIDCGEDKAANGKGYADIGEAREALETFCREAGLPNPAHIINSGSGIHVYWTFDRQIAREIWQENAKKLKALTKAIGLLADDSRTADIASVLRIPGTLNHKYDPPAKVEILSEHGDPLRVVDFLSAMDAAHQRLCSQPNDLRHDTKRILETDDGPVDFDRLRSALQCLDPDCEEVEWKLRRIAPIARAAAANPEQAKQLRKLARAWSSGDLRGAPAKAWSTPGNTNKRTGEQTFDDVWNRFFDEAPSESHTTLGSLFHDAKSADWEGPSMPKLVASDQAIAVPETATEEFPDPLSVVQDRYALLNLNGKLFVVDLRCLCVDPYTGNAKALALSGRTDARLIVERAVREKFPEVDASAIVTDFFSSPTTRLFEGVAFSPSERAGSRLNLWTGPTISPEEGTWRLIHEFLLTVICNGASDAHGYLIRYIAHALQKPEEKPGVMIILLGGQGTGKGTFGRILQHIWRATFLQVHNMHDVTGSFNGALERAFIVFLDEALFVGDRRSTDALKSIVTEPTLHINEKHQPSRQIESFHRLIAATNAEHFKHTDRDDRRDFVLRLSEERKADHAYWTALNEEIENGGVEAMAHDLLAMELSDFNVRQKPQTAALVDQKLQSLDGIEEWWLECLRDGELSDDEGWPEFVATEDLVTSIRDSGVRTFKRPTSRKVVEAFRKFCPSAQQDQRKDPNFSTKRRGLLMPPLDVARVEFEEYVGGPVDW